MFDNSSVSEVDDCDVVVRLLERCDTFRVAGCVLSRVKK